MGDDLGVGIVDGQERAPEKHGRQAEYEPDSHDAHQAAPQYGDDAADLVRSGS